MQKVPLISVEHPLDRVGFRRVEIENGQTLLNGRARSFNNKGILNEHRKPKAAYFAVAEKFKAFRDDQ